MSGEDIYSALAREFAPTYRIPELTQSRDWANRFARAMGRPEDAKSLLQRLFPRETLDFHGVRKEWEAALGEAREAAVHFYVHVLFCKEICAFCSYYTLQLRDERALDAYLKRVDDALAFFAPAFKGRPMRSFYVGGGTPSILSEDRLERFLGGIFDRYSFDERGQKTFEMNPASVTPGKLKLLRRFGINRISVGVQTFRTGALTAENREYQDRRMVVDALSAVREAGDFFLNADLLIGMRGDDEAGFLESLDGLMGLGPDNIIVYTVQPTPRYLKAFHNGAPARFAADMAARYPETGRKAREIARSRGYRVKGKLRIDETEWHFAHPRSTCDFSAVYADYSGEPDSFFSLGPTSRSRIAGRLQYTEGVSRGAFDPGERVHAGERLSARGEMTRYLILRMAAERAISPKRFEELFGLGVREAFAGAFGQLAGSPDIIEEPGHIRFTAEEPRRLFEQALRFMDVRAALEGLCGGEIQLSSASASLTLVIEEASTGAGYLAESGGLGLRVRGELSSVIPDHVYREALSLLDSLFKRAAREGGGPAAAASRLLADLAAAAPRLGLRASETSFYEVP